MNSDTQCQACNIECKTFANLNLHLRLCDKYDSWIKTYTPPKGIKCTCCDLIFLNEKVLHEHSMNKNI